MKSYCFNSQQIREAIEDGKIIVPSFDESRIQPSSFDPIIGEELFVLDTETKGLFRGNSRESVYRTLLELPKRQRQKINISGGFELKKGFTYLTPLEEKVKLSEGEHIKSSPKSSFGRLFLNTRLLGDYNPCFDEINSRYCLDQEINLWLFVQPLAFNIIMYPGYALNQLRFFKGLEAQLTDSQLMKEIKKNPLLYIRDSEGELTPADSLVTDGLEIHLDLSGKYTDGIVGLRARHNPTPIDIKRKGAYEAEDFFEPLKGEKITIKREEHYLFASSEILEIPKHLNVEVRSHSQIGFNGPLHFAGFVDNGFNGDLVFEVRPDEISYIELEDGMPVSKLDVFRTLIPDKLYGKDIGSHYQDQIGARPSKHFKEFDFTHAARNYEKLDRIVLVQAIETLKKHRKKADGFEVLIGDESLALFRDIENGFFQSRYDCEDDDLILQPIPYVLLFNNKNEIFTYVRSKDIKEYGDERLFGKHSIGLGGHIIKSDGPNYIDNCLEREVMQEEIEIQGNYSEPRLRGTLMAYDKPVDRVHFGLIYSINVDGNVKVKESSIISGRMVSIKELMRDNSEKYETWSRVLIPYLHELSK